MLAKSHSRKAQAVLEIGLLGSLILIVFSLVIGYIQRLNDDQYVLMSKYQQEIYMLGCFLNRLFFEFWS